MISKNLGNLIIRHISDKLLSTYNFIEPSFFIMFILLESAIKGGKVNFNFFKNILLLRLHKIIKTMYCIFCNIFHSITTLQGF